MPVDSEFRGRFHFSAPRAWLNDPNGLSWFQDELHLFYQHHPHSSAWGSMHWGHAVTTDLVSWTPLPLALAPDQPYDADGCFSGGAVADGPRHVLLYTGHLDPEPSDPRQRFETQCLAVGDGRVYRKSRRNPVIDATLLPSGASRGDFRDPKVWKEGETWYCLVANRHRDGHGQILLFTARDPEQWSFVGTVLQSRGALGGMWECPDLFVLDGRDVLVWSVMGQPSEPGAFRNPSSVVWSPGTLNRQTGEFTPDRIREIDHGLDFYAAQTVTIPDGRVLLIAWMQMWERSIPTHTQNHGWAGQMTMLREVFWLGDRLAQRPVREWDALRTRGVTHQAEVQGSVEVPEVEGQFADLELEFCRWTAERFGVGFWGGDGEETLLTFEPSTGWLVLDRSQGGVPISTTSMSHPGCQVSQVAVEAPEGLSLRLILDRSSVEVFVQGGVETLSSTVYPRATSRRVRFFAEGGRVELTCRAWALEGASR